MKPMPGGYTNHRNRNRRHDQACQSKIAELPYDQTIDQYQRCHEREPHVTEGFKSNRPLPGPLKTRYRIIIRRTD